MIELINPILSLLNSYRPQILETLRQEYPATASSLEPTGLVLGEADDAAIRGAAIALLDNSGSIADEAAAAAISRLRTARRLELAGSMIAVASSAGVISALSGLLDSKGALPLAIVAFVAGAIPLVSGWLRNTDGGASVAESLTRLRAVTWEAQALRGRISRGDGPSDLVDEVNSIARKLADELASLGYPAAVRPL